MLKATIALADLAFPPHWSGGTLAFGDSRIAPHEHPALESMLIRTDGRWFAVVRERGAAAAEASVVDVDAAEFERRHRECLLWPLDYVMVEAAQAGCRLKVRAGVFGSLPVYARATDERLELSWDAADLTAAPTALDVEIASHRLALHTVYSARQLCVGIILLTERASLSVEPGKASHQYPPPARDPAWMPASEAGTVLADFAACLRGVLDARPFAPDRAALELSGGMDSATVACSLTDRFGALASLGILLEGDTRRPQLARRRAIVERLGLRDRTVEIADFQPSLDLRPQAGRRLGFHQEYYLEACAALWDMARAQGCDRLYTGLGGDELFPDYAHELASDGDGAEALELQRERAHREEVMALLTPRAQEAARSLHCFGAPSAPVPTTALAAQACRAPDIARRGLWPVNPLSDPRLAHFCHRLPREHRRQRALMRHYLQARLGEDTFPAGYRKETFEQVFPALIATQAPTLAAQLRECALADLGLVDPRGVERLLDAVATRRARAPTAVLVSFLWLERFVRQLA